jgi:hypothetical protein
VVRLTLLVNLIYDNIIIGPHSQVNVFFLVIFFTISLDLDCLPCLYLFEDDIGVYALRSGRLEAVLAASESEQCIQMPAAAKFKSPHFHRDIIVIVGGFGSGKSEVSVNLARYLMATGTRPVTLADLDIVNPYFRSREAATALAALGIRSIAPSGAYATADLPIIIPEVKSAIQQPEGRLILDVGGDDTGATVLSSLSDAFTPDGYDLLFTLNAYRPFTSDVKGTLKIMGEIEKAGGLKFTGLISNSHLIEQTTTAEVLHGIDLARQVSEQTGLPILFVSAVDSVLSQLDARQIPYPVLAINRSLLKPWERSSPAGTN